MPLYQSAREFDEPVLWSKKKAAETLAVNIKTVDRLIDRGEIPVIRIGRAVRIEKKEIHRFIEAKRTYNGSGVESAVRNPIGERKCRLKTPSDVKMEVPTKVRTTRSVSPRMEKDYNALLGLKP